MQPEGWVNADDRYYGQEYWVNPLGNQGVQPMGHDESLERVLPGEHFGPQFSFDPITRKLLAIGPYDYIVANHLLSCFSHHELIGKVLPNLRRMLKDGGVLRVLVPDAEKAARAYLAGVAQFFPLGDDLPEVSERFCTFLPWFGESKSIFDASYLCGLGAKAGFSTQVQCAFGESWLLPNSEITSLDDRQEQSLIMEFRK